MTEAVASSTAVDGEAESSVDTLEATATTDAAAEGNLPVNGEAKEAAMAQEAVEEASEVEPAQNDGEETATAAPPPASQGKGAPRSARGGKGKRCGCCPFPRRHSGVCWELDDWSCLVVYMFRVVCSFLICICLHPLDREPYGRSRIRLPFDPENP